MENIEIAKNYDSSNRKEINHKKRIKKNLVGFAFVGYASLAPIMILTQEKGLLLIGAVIVGEFVYVSSKIVNTINLISTTEFETENSAQLDNDCEFEDIDRVNNYHIYSGYTDENIDNRSCLVYEKNKAKIRVRKRQIK